MDAPHITFLTRLPEPGQVKTRLGLTLGPQRAAELHDELARHCLRIIRPIAATGEARLSIAFSSEDARAADVRRWLDVDRGIRVGSQHGSDLGARILAALENGFDSGGAASLAVGSDCPGLDARVLREALARLEHADCVLGPAADGGYYVIGATLAARDRLPGLFADIPWGGSDVLARTLERAEAAGLSVEQLAVLDDVDRPEDLPVWEEARDVERLDASSRVSVVIPTLDEEHDISGAVGSALSAGASEVIVADGGSRDATREVARRAGALVVEVPPGRAAQMNAGAEAASGDALVFLHADTRLPEGAATAVLVVLSEPAVAGGGFSFASREPDRRSRMLAMGARIRCQWTHHPYGDQAIFVRSREFDRLGGFPALPVMEDWEFVRRLKRLGGVVVLDERAGTSTRSFQEHGFAKGLIVNAAVIGGHTAGVKTERLARWRGRVNARSAR